MKRFSLCFAVMMIAYFVCLQSDVYSEILGCKKIKRGQFRIVNNLEECMVNEEPVVLSDIIIKPQAQIACVTGAFGRIEPSNGDIIIMNEQNIDISSPDDVFQTYSSSPEFVDDIQWGLRCKDGWVNTGCSISADHNQYYDNPQYDNGCHSDDEEYYDVLIFTTCCKVVYGSSN